MGQLFFRATTFFYQAITFTVTPRRVPTPATLRFWAKWQPVPRNVQPCNDGNIYAQWLAWLCTNYLLLFHSPSELAVASSSLAVNFYALLPYTTTLLTSPVSLECHTPPLSLFTSPAAGNNRVGPARGWEHRQATFKLR